MSLPKSRFLRHRTSTTNGTYNRLIRIFCLLLRFYCENIARYARFPHRSSLDHIRGLR